MNEAKLDERLKKIAMEAAWPYSSIEQMICAACEAVLSASGLVSKEERDREWDEAVRTYFWVCFGHFDIVMLKMIRKRLGLAPSSGEQPASPAPAPASAEGDVVLQIKAILRTRRELTPEVIEEFSGRIIAVANKHRDAQWHNRFELCYHDILKKDCEQCCNLPQIAPAPEKAAELARRENASE